MEPEQLKRVTWQSIAAFQRLLGHHPEGRLLERQDFVASSVPVSNSSLINAVVPGLDAAVAPHLKEIVRFYEDIPKWGVWIDPANTADATALEDRGLVLDSTPVLMAAPIDTVERTPDPRVERVTLEEVGVVNDAAYGIPKGTLGSAIAGIRPGDVRAYGIREGGEVASVVVIQNADGDAFVAFVATLPDRRGMRLASAVLRTALADNDVGTTSLQASKLGQSIYARLGYRPLGEIHLYEKRPA
jgi:hypothetical protein